jgi:excisionase family DNA binding protein
MADEKIVIDGEQYISSGRAAKLVGYTKDYVGQLARLGKIKATRVGRNWYINEASINKHKLSVHYTLTKPKKTKQQNTEKPIQNIHNSETIKRDSPIEAVVKSEKETEKKPNEEALFPVPRKLKRDPLLHSEIRYEHDDNHTEIKKHTPEKPLSHLRDEPVATQKPTYQPFSTTRPLRHRLPRKNLLTLEKTTRATNDAIPNAAIDGIVLQKKRVTPIHENSNALRNRPSYQLEEEPFKKDDSYEAPQEYAEEDYADELEHNDDSKMVPVIAAIIAFTLFVIVYILFFLD